MENSSEQISNGKNKKIWIPVGIIVLAIIVGLVFVNRSSKKAEELSLPANSTANNGQTYETITSNENGVEVSVTPINLTPSSKEWSFRVSLNTHSQDLSEDLALVSELALSNGQTVKPLAWEGDAPGGHHRNGILKFSAVPGTVSDLTLRIFKVGGIPIREFKWKIK